MGIIVKSAINPFQSAPDFLILLWLTLDDFIHQGEMYRTGKD